MTGAVIGFGELLLRLTPASRKMIAQSQSLDIELGGAEANVMAGLASLGHDSALISRVADNPLGRLATATLRARGVDTRHISTAPGRMGLYFLEAGQGFRASAITYDRKGSAFALTDADAFDFDAALGGARLVDHVSEVPAGKGVPACRRAQAGRNEVFFSGTV